MILLIILVLIAPERLSPSCAGSSLATSHLAVNACLAPLCSMHGLAVTTAEAIGDTKTRLHPVQVGQGYCIIKKLTYFK